MLTMECGVYICVFEREDVEFCCNAFKVQARESGSELGRCDAGSGAGTMQVR